MNRLHKRFDSISTRVECFFNSKSKPIESQDYPKNHNFGNLLFEFQWCYIIYSVDGLVQKYNEHENRCTYKTDLEWMPYINRNRLTDRHEIERVCVCPSIENDTKTQWISIELEIQSITQAKFYEYEKKHQDVLIAIVQAWSEFYCASDHFGLTGKLLCPVENTLSNLYKLCNDLINKSFLYTHIMLLISKKTSHSILDRNKKTPNPQTM